MTCFVPGCLGNYDFDHIAAFAKKRYIDGCDTIALLQQADSQREKEEIVLVSLLDLEDDQIRDIEFTCRHADKCTIMDCRARLKRMIAEALSET